MYLIGFQLIGKDAFANLMKGAYWFNYENLNIKTMKQYYV